MTDVRFTIVGSGAIGGTVGGFVNFSADLIEPGRIRYFGPGDFYLGKLNGSISSRVHALTDALRPWGDVKPTDNIWGYLWSKLAYANMLFATALADADQADVVSRFRKLMVALAVEVCEVAESESVRLTPFHGFDPGLYRGHGWEEVDVSLDGLLSYMRVHQKPRSGIWRDLAVRRRKTEVDHQIGLAVEIGHSHDLELPRTRRLGRMIHEIEDGTRPMTWSNLEELATT
jgi:2-dehydropantoate 2-reductase